jgi:type IX secretion system PorP/SprF family membrane protein
MRKIITTTAICIVMAQLTVRAQDIHFSQFYMSPLTMNPALAGAEHDLNAGLNYKNQWQSVAAPYKTMGATFDIRLTKSRDTRGFLAGGINFFSDKAGDAQMGTTNGALSLAYHLYTGKYSTIGTGIQFGFGQRSINYSALQWGDQYDGMAYNPALSSGEAANNSMSYLDGSAGIDWNYDNMSGAIDVTDNHDQKANIGIAVFHINQPSYSFYGTGEKLYMKYVLHGNGLFSIINTNLAIRPGFMVAIQGGAYEVYLGTMMRFKLKQASKYTGIFKNSALSIGGYYRAQDAFVASMLLEYSHYAIGVSYDINTSGLTPASSGRGGMEIALRYVLPNPFEPVASRAMF